MPTPVKHNPVFRQYILAQNKVKKRLLKQCTFLQIAVLLKKKKMQILTKS